MAADVNSLLILARSLKLEKNNTSLFLLPIKYRTPATLRLPIILHFVHPNRKGKENGGKISILVVIKIK
jgi:hypothetical protein